MKKLMFAIALALFSITALAATRPAPKPIPFCLDWFWSSPTCPDLRV